MSALIELTDDEIRVLGAIMAKVGFPVISTTPKPVKKISKNDLIRLSIMEARTKKALRKRNN